MKRKRGRGATDNFAPMQASNAGPKLRFPLLASPKLDGIRCLIINGRAMSRSLKPIPNAHVQKLYGHARFNGLDGELIVGEPTAKDCYRRTSSGVMKVEGCPDVCFYVFDDFSADRYSELGFEMRLDAVYDRVPTNRKWMSVVEHFRCDNYNDVEEHETRWLKEGYEGVMLRDPSGPYKYGRSTVKEGWLLKLKRFQDSEAQITGVVPLYTNRNKAKRDELGRLKRSSHKAGKVQQNLLGALKVSDLKTDVDFEIGTGFTAHERRHLWEQKAYLPGRIVKYKFLAIGVKDKPRHPVFLGFRDGRDM